MVNDGPTQSKVRALHGRQRSVSEIARELGITPDRVRRIHAGLHLLPWRAQAHSTGAREPESRQDQERRVAFRRAAVGGYWRAHPTDSAADVAHALGYPVTDVRADRRVLGLHVRRGPDSIRRLAAEGLPVGEIARRTGVGADRIRQALAEGGTPDTD
ncbi:MAG: hypothetical protein KGI42_03340 [Xanthomonadaceae bacterium]|nr:hypothetical protein [Xanthomonadaceae bacterium]